MLGAGERYPSYHNQEGKQTVEQGDRIGMLLDLDQGSMTVWKNDVKVGVMVAEGLSGPLCWAVSKRRAIAHVPHRVGAAAERASCTDGRGNGESMMNVLI